MGALAPPPRTSLRSSSDTRRIASVVGRWVVVTSTNGSSTAGSTIRADWSAPPSESRAPSSVVIVHPCPAATSAFCITSVSTSVTKRGCAAILRAVCSICRRNALGARAMMSLSPSSALAGTVSPAVSGSPAGPTRWIGIVRRVSSVGPTPPGSRSSMARSTRPVATASASCPVLPWVRWSCTSGYFSSTAATSSAAMSIEGSKPIATRPAGTPARLRMVSITSSASASSARTRGRIAAPISVGTTPRPVRWNSSHPQVSSSAVIWRLSTDCGRSVITAAFDRLPASAIATNSDQRSRSSAIIRSPLLPVIAASMLLCRSLDSELPIGGIEFRS